MYLKRVLENIPAAPAGRRKSVIYHLHAADGSRIVSQSGDFDGVFQLPTYRDATDSLGDSSEFLVVTTGGFYLEIRVVPEPDRKIEPPDRIEL